MNSAICALVSTALALAPLTGCRQDGVQPPSANQQPSVRVLPFPTNQIVRAITNVFANLRYRDMMLERAETFDLVPGWHNTDGFVLSPTAKPIAMLSVQGQPQPYFAYFHISVEPVQPTSSLVTVRTLLAKVVSGRTIGIHGGWADRYKEVSPSMQEQQNVLDAIQAALQTGP